MALILFLAGLGVLLFPKWASARSALLGWRSFAVAAQHFFPALRIALLPKEVRVLLLPQYYVIFGPVHFFKTSRKEDILGSVSSEIFTKGASGREIEAAPIFMRKVASYRGWAFLDT